MAAFNFTTTAKGSSSLTSGLRSASELERELVSRDAILLGAPIALLVLAVSSMCCIVLLRWNMKVRLRRNANNTSSDDSIINGSAHLQTAEGTTPRDPAL